MSSAGTIRPQSIFALTEAEVRRKGTQGGHVRKRGDSWYIRFSEWRLTDAGWAWAETERKIDTGGKDVRESAAQRLGYEQHVRQANQLNKAPQGLATFQHFAEQLWLPAARTRLKWTPTIESALRTHLVPAFGMLQMAEIRRSMVQAWVNRVAGTLSGGTIKRYVWILHDVFRHYADLYDTETQNPAERLSLPRTQPKEREALTLDQALQLAAKLSVMRADVGRLALILLYTGCRIGEVLSLKWGGVDLEQGELRIQRTKNGRPKRVPLIAEAVRVIREQLAAAGEWSGMEHLVFRGRGGVVMSVSSLSANYFKPAASALGLGNISWHWLRHTTATLTDKHLTAAQRQKLLGHAGAGMTMHYTHPEAAALRDGLEKAMRKESVQ